LRLLPTLDASLTGLLMAITLVVYLPTLRIYFHGDDFVAFVDLVSRQPVDHLWRVLTFSDYNFYWRPLGDIFHHALYDAFGFDVVAFRLAALLIFLATLIALYAFCLGERLGQLTALGSVLVLGVVPNHALSVTWVTNTSRLMAGLLFLLCLLQKQ